MASTTDIRIKSLSYSGRLSLHECPRKYQLSRLNAEKQLPEDFESSVTFAFGHVVGLGIQLHFEGATLDQIIWRLVTFWEPDLFAENQKQKKSFWLAVAAIQNFVSMREQGFLSDWRLVYVDSKPATELSFSIALPDGYRYRGFVDAVLQHYKTGEVRVLEVKTTSTANLNPAQYKNSAQAIGYSIVLDQLFPSISSYDVLYLVYKTKELAYETLQFTKNYLQRALWLQELLLDVELLQLYEARGVYPQYGESCYSFYRECEYMQTCTLATEHLTSPMTATEQAAFIEKESKYQIQVSIIDLIHTQLTKDSHETN